MLHERFRSVRRTVFMESRRTAASRARELSADAVPANDKLTKPASAALDNRAAALKAAAKATPTVKATVEPPTTITIKIKIDSHSARTDPNPLCRGGNRSRDGNQEGQCDSGEDHFQSVSS